MGSGKPKLTLVSNAKPRRRTAGKPLQCVCGSRATIEVRLDRRLERGKVTAGQKQLRCAECGAVVWG